MRFFLLYLVAWPKNLLEWGMISNCAACGHDSYVQPMTGVVSRKDKVTGMTEPASVRPNGVPETPKPATSNQINGVTAAALFAEDVVPVQPVRAVAAYRR